LLSASAHAALAALLVSLLVVGFGVDVFARLPRPRDALRSYFWKSCATIFSKSGATPLLRVFGLSAAGVFTFFSLFGVLPRAPFVFAFAFGLCLGLAAAEPASFLAISAKRPAMKAEASASRCF
jgi:hypothetical protein